MKLYKRVFPAVGCYGRLVAIGNPGRKPDDEQIGPLRASQMTDAEEHLTTPFDWKAEVLRLLRTVDVAIIDVSEFSRNVEWELRTALAHLPSSRVILLIEVTAGARRTADDVAGVWLECGGEVEDFEFVMYLSWRAIPKRFWNYWPFKLERTLHRRMRKIARAADPPHSEPPGAAKAQPV